MEIHDWNVGIAAAKARGYFDVHGRGVLSRRSMDADGDTTILDWMRAVVNRDECGIHAFKNEYVSLPMLRKGAAPRDVIALVERYDPDREAVVYVEYEHGYFGPAIVPLSLPVQH